MPANGRRDLIRRLKVKVKCNYNANMSKSNTIKHTFTMLRQTDG